jgi:hypothetical protein
MATKHKRKTAPKVVVKRRKPAPAKQEMPAPAAAIAMPAPAVEIPTMPVAGVDAPSFPQH